MKISTTKEGVEIRMRLKKRSRFSDTVFHEIDFTDYGLHRDYPPAWKLTFRFSLMLKASIYEMYGFSVLAEMCAQQVLSVSLSDDNFARDRNFRSQKSRNIVNLNLNFVNYFNP